MRFIWRFLHWSGERWWLDGDGHHVSLRGRLNHGPMDADTCPHCGADLRGAEIAPESRHYYATGTTHYSRRISMEIRGVYDGGLFWMCPDCGGKWHRWPEGHPLRAKAQPYVDQK